MEPQGLERDLAEGGDDLGAITLMPVLGRQPVTKPPHIGRSAIEPQANDADEFPIRLQCDDKREALAFRSCESIGAHVSNFISNRIGAWSDREAAQNPRIVYDLGKDGSIGHLVESKQESAGSKGQPNIREPPT